MPIEPKISVPDMETLETFTTEELVAELVKRYDYFLWIGVEARTNKNKCENIHWACSPDLIVALGLLERLHMLVGRCYEEIDDDDDCDK